VDRFCSLVEEIAHSLSTRFLVITHHRMTMARVDRLFGVTMGEQGVSQLVSVDLGQAMEMRATA
jgi:chromosome segregation protein